MGATAGRALAGPSFRVSKERGVLLPWAEHATADLPADAAGHLLATLHPSAVLRAEDRDEAYAGLVADLAVAARPLG